MKLVRNKLFFVLGYLVPWELLFTGSLFTHMNEDLFAVLLVTLGLILPFATLLVAGRWARERDDLKALWCLLFGLQVLRTAFGGMAFLEDGGWFFWNYGAGSGPMLPMAIFVPSIGTPWTRLLTIPLGIWFMARASRDEDKSEV